MRKLMKLKFALLIISIMFMLKTPICYGVGVGVNPAELNYTVVSEGIFTLEIWVINTGDVRTRYDLYFEGQHQSMFTFSSNGFELDPESNQKVDVNYDSSQNLEKKDLNIDLNVKGTGVGSNIETGIQVPVIVNHQISTTTTSTTVSGHNFPLNPNDPEILKAFGYLTGMQGSDGGIGGFSISCWVTMAIASSGYNPNEWRKNGNSIVDYLINNKNQIDENEAIDIAKFILALTAAKVNPRDVEGVDYVSMLEGKENNNQFGGESIWNDDFWTIMALVSAGIDPNSPSIQNAASFIKSHQNGDGGWSWHGGPSDADNTGAAIMALIAAGETKDSSHILNAVNYLESQLDSNGGFIFMGEGNSASDSWSIMALNSANINPTDPNWIRNNMSPVDHLLNLQNPDGSFSWKQGEDGNIWWTAYAIPALLGQHYPISVDFTLQYTTTTTSETESTPQYNEGITTSATKLEQVYIRVEDLTGTVWRGWIEIPEYATINCYNSGNSYDIAGNNVLAILDKASETGGFTYQASDKWYPDIGFFVDTISGHKAEGEYGWMYLVNYVSGDASMDNYQVAASDEIIIYWGTQNVRPLKIEVDPIEVDLGEPFTATVKFRDDSTGDWNPLEGVTIHVNDDYVTDKEGKVDITLHEERVYEIYAEKWGDSAEDQYIRSDVIHVGVGVPVPEFASHLPLITVLLLSALLIIYLRKRDKRYR